MIKEIKSCILLCDKCNTDYTNKRNRFSIFTDDCEPLEYSKYDDWIEYNDKHYCPSCYKIDESDNNTDYLIK